MATKMANGNLYNIVLKAKKYHTPDVFIALTYLSSQVKDINKKEHLILQTGTEKLAALVKTVENFTKINRQTVANCINEIINLGLLEYNSTLSAWELLNSIDNMLKDGYTLLHEILFSDFFKTLKLREKKLLMYMLHLSCSKNSTKYKNVTGTDFIININNEDSMWNKIVTSSKYRTAVYFVKYTLEKFINKLKANNIIQDLTDDKRDRDFRPSSYKQFLFYFNAPELKKKESAVDELTEKKSATEIEIIKVYCEDYNVDLTTKQTYQLAHAISGLTSWKLKDFITRTIMNKFRAIQIHKSRENIKSLPAYVAAIIREITFKKIGDINDINVNPNIKTLQFS